ncbi:MAG TPA: hypothetical protein VKD90_20005 [Gemmataceae bacterium]|nr:hypothetical protein [Gemmataceae bacterium]
MRRGFVFAIATVTVLAALSSPPSFAQPTTTTGGVVVQSAPPPGTVTVTPVPVAPAPGVIMQPGAPPVGTPLNCPECRGARIQGQRYLPPSVSVCIPGPPNYGPGPCLVSRYDPLSGPPYAIPTFPTVVESGGPVRVSYMSGRTSTISVVAPAGQTFPADVRVTAVEDMANSITWDVKTVSTSPDRKTLNVTIEGKGLAKTTGKGPEGGNLAITLAGSGSPRVDPVRVVYIVPQ